MIPLLDTEYKIDAEYKIIMTEKDLNNLVDRAQKLAKENRTWTY